MGRAAALATDTEHVNVVADDISEIDRHRLGWEGGEANPPAAIGHSARLIHRVGSARAFQHVLHALPAGDPLNRCHGVLAADVDDLVGAEPPPHLQPLVPRSGQNDRLCPQSFGDGDAHQTDRSRTDDHDALSGDDPAHYVETVHGGPGGDDQRRLRLTHFRSDGDAHQTDRSRTDDHDALSGDDPAHYVETVHGGPGGDDQRRLRVTHFVRNVDHRVDVVDGIFGEPAVRAEPVGAMSLFAKAVIEARGVHSLTASLATAASGMNLNGDAIADLKLI